MAKEIAVFVGDNGVTAELQQPGKIIVYLKKQNQWQKLREQEFTLGQARGARELRAGIAEIVDFINDCKIFVGQSITGLPYFELEKAGCSVWEFAGEPLDFLDYVLEKEEEAVEETDSKSIAMPIPEDLGNGHYRISIREIQEKDTGITSKQALQPILRPGNFDQLEIICSHIPPWLEADIMNGNLQGVSEMIALGETRVVISKK